MICEEHDKSVCPELLGCPWCEAVAARAEWTKLYVELDKTKGEMQELLAYCEMLENIVMERGINADFMWKAKRATEKLERIREALNEDDLEIMVKSYLEGILDES